MGERTFSGEERIGLFVAAVLHLALVLVLLLQPSKREEIIPVERMTVNLAEDVGMEATAPDPVPESRAAIAPTIADTPAPAPEPVAQLEPQPVPQPVQQPVRRPVERTRPAPAPTRPAQAQPRRRPDPPRAERPAPEQPRQAQPRPAPSRPAERSGGSRIGDNFLAGAGDSTRSSETRTPASQIGASAKASLVQAISRRIKPHWSPPNGPEVEEITTFLRFRLNENGSLAGRPEVVRQTGVNDVNRAQASRHAEQAIRAVQLAAPFSDLPEEYYEAWKLVGPFSFDWRLAQ
ncbi:energy transducer TonB [Qipengyuania spongiae]|uniref:Energy transducer TonB n=1 Tax=Qipengyuania spongiae TaxID=2909673 RepID=A0ABY5T1G7_9SPHN|nr:energy transducer TonB [Qipengyuania spongiae]UVI40618.1 energy transducer TonB [Qipengyuania spongiae]